MRFDELYKDLLLEHNVINTDAIKSFCARFAEKCKNPNAAEWFNVTLARTLEKDDKFNKKIGPTEVPRTAPGWVSDAVERGDDLRLFEPPHNMITDFEHLVDYFNWLSETDAPVLADRNRVLKVTLAVALRKADEWVAAAAKNAAKEGVKDMTVIRQDGYYSWMEATSMAAFKRDGAILHHCTASGSSYDDSFKNGSMRFFFLHDPHGQPHVCISIEKQTPQWALDQVKGKQNKPPVGRYIQLCAGFLNWLVSENYITAQNAAHNHDVTRMGLLLNKKGLLTSASQVESSKLIGQIGTVKVFRVDGATYSISVRDGNYLGNYRNETAGGGDDYWFVDGGVDLFKLNIADGKAYVAAFPEEHKEKCRSVLREFLNGLDVVPPPLETHHSGAGTNKLIYGGLDLRYDFLTKRYGSIREINNVIARKGKWTGYLFQHQDEKLPAIYALQDGDDDLEDGYKVDGYNAEAKTFIYIASRDFKRTRDEENYPRKDVIDILNMLDVSLAESFNGQQRSIFRQQNIYCNQDNQWGDLTEVLPAVWQKGQYGFYLNVEDDGKKREYLLGRKGTHDRLFVLTTKRADRDEAGDADLPKIFVSAFNASEELSEVAQQVADELTEEDVLFSNGKWKLREDASTLFHSFDNGTEWKVVAYPADGKHLFEYSLYEGGKLIMVLTLEENKKLVRTRRIAEDALRYSNETVWLFNRIDPAVNMPGTRNFSPVSSHNEKSLSVRNFIVLMGLYVDARAESWKLIQDGRLIYQGSDFRAVNFRNMIFFAKQSGLVGYVKKEGNQLNHFEHFPPATLADLMHCVVELCDNSDYSFHIAPDDYEAYKMKAAGFAHHPETNRFDHAEKFYPTETVVKLKGGYEWRRMAIDPQWHNFDKGKPLSSDRYSLCDKNGQSFMRADFDDGYLVDIRFHAEDKLGQGKVRESVGEMTETQKKALFALMEKKDFKLLPKDARAIGYYKSKGKFKSLKGNKLLQQYLAGLIVFPDGHIFKADAYERTDPEDDSKRVTRWQLGVEVDPNATLDYERYKFYLQIDLSDEGIERVRYSSKEAKRSPNTYMPYLKTLMAIFHKVAGD